MTTTFDPSSGQALFPDLNITGFGMFVVQFRVVSSPDDYNLTLNHKIYIVNPAHVGHTVEEENEIEVKFDEDYNKVLPTADKQDEFEQMILSEYSNIWPDVQLKKGSIRECSIVVSFTIAGTTTNVNSMAYSLCDSITNGTSYSFNGFTLTLSQYMTINNITYYGVTCGSVDDDNEGLKAYVIALIVLFSVLIFVAMMILLVWRLAFKPKMQTHSQGTFYVGHMVRPVEDVLFNENSFTSLKFHNSAAIAPPVATYIQNPPPQYEYFKQPLTG